jgi:hypothetical protein
MIKEKEMSDQAEIVVCPNCGKENTKRYILMIGARGWGKSLQRLADELNFCDVSCVIEFAMKNGLLPIKEDMDEMGKT